MEGLNIYRDRDGDFWADSLPGRLLSAGSESHAERLKGSAYLGNTIATIERLYGPLSPLEGDESNE